MRAPAFWQRRGLLAALLAPFGWCYGAITLWRLRRTGRKAGIPVFCVGNPTLGGVGKTPFAAMLADRLQALGQNPAIVLRGYSGRLPGPLVVDPSRHGARDVGDEALQHAANRLTIIARDRFQGAELARQAGATCIVLDDGFQNPTLHKDISLLLVDAATGLGNGAVFPAGPLRAPFLPQLARANALVVVGEGVTGDILAHQALLAGKPVLSAALRVDHQAVSAVVGQPLLAFCALGRPEKFAQSLRQAGCSDVVLVPFPDHHAYSERDAAALLQRAEREGRHLVTTQKDAVKLVGTPSLAALAERTTVVPARMQMNAGTAELEALIGRGLSSAL